jgi:protein-disulfide isomerase
MLQKSIRALFPIILFILLILPAGASNYLEPKGLVMGGSLDSPVRIEIFANFECTHCREYYLRTIKKVLKEYASENKVCVIYHEFPFQSHKYDRKAARFAEAASRIGQDTLLKVYDAFYTEQATWYENGKLEEVLKKALSKDEFDKIMEISKDPEIDSLIEAQYQLAMEKGLDATPTTFIFYAGKEKQVEGVLTYIVLKGFIEQILG